MRKRVLKIFFILILAILVFSPRTDAFAQGSAEDKIKRLSEEIARYEAEIDKLKSQASTLSNQIAQYDAQIKLTSLKIEETAEQIFLLTGRIGQLTESLDALNSAFASRARETYKIARVGGNFYLLLVSSSDLSSVVSSFHYLQKIQSADRDLLVRLKNAQGVYIEEKKDQEKLESNLKIQQSNLNSQKAAKSKLLTDTKNDEKKYQDLLAQARAEFEAIQAIIAGKGQEEEAGKVKDGDKIATVIAGPSCNSSGSHLHFIVSTNGQSENPFNFLAGVDHENCSGSSCGGGDGDSFNPGGSWSWPLKSKIRFYQGYGATWAVKNTWVGRIYQFHNGIDVDSTSSPDVFAVKSGTMFRGSYTGIDGCRLRYVRVDHDEGDIDTLYLHINYI